MKPRLLDAFCCAGGAGRGYQLAGFHVTGIDIAPQRNYIGDEFVQGDALAFIRDHGHESAAVHASPPCQGYSVTASLHDVVYPRLVEDVRDLLEATGPIDVTGTGGPASRQPGQGGGIHRKPRNLAHAREVMGIPWMSRRELAEAVPPAYTEWVGSHLLAVLKVAA